MKKRMIFALMILTMCLVCVGCGDSDSSTEKSSEEDTATVVTTPEWIDDIYIGYQEVVSDNNLGFTIGDLFNGEDKDGNKTYGIRLTSKDSFEFDVNWSEYNGELSRNFNIDLDEKADIATLKEYMACTIATIDPKHDYSNAQGIVKQLVNSFNGKEETQPIQVGKYKIYIKPTISATLCSDTMEFVYIEEQNVAVDTSQYQDFSGDEMNAPLNKGEKAHLKGKITSDVEIQNTNALEIENDNGKYVVYYNSQDFAGMFKIGDAFDFYGVIAAEWEGYKGAMRLEYFE